LIRPGKVDKASNRMSAGFRKRLDGGKRMIRAIVFDFGQTLVDSADGFRTAEK
jgi:hypothetical protein